VFRLRRITYSLFLTLFCASAISAQQNTPPAEHPPGRIDLDVVVTEKSGPPLAGLQRQDFTILDNDAPQTIGSFEAVSPRETDLAVILVMDAVNTSIKDFTYSRTEIARFLRADDGHLAYPFALVTFTDKGVQIEDSFSTDGNGLAAKLDRNSVGIRNSGMARSTGAHGEAGRLQLSIQAFDQIVASEAQVPGRKLVIWLSPGWPFMAELRLDSKQQQQIYDSVVRLSDDLLQSHVTLYSVDPIGASDAAIGDSYYKQFLKGVTKPHQVYAGNLALQVLAIQSGGLAFPPTNDIVGIVRQCLRASAPYYEISFDAPESKRPREYHHLEIKLAKTGLIARTLQGYYAQPVGRD
jgi:VWFA-related protein